MNRKYLLFIAGLMLVLNACNVKDTPSPGSANGASAQQNTMQDASDQAGDDVVDMVSSEGVVAVASLSQFMNQDAAFNFRKDGKLDLKDVKALAKHKFSRLKTLFIPADKMRTDGEGDERFIFKEHLGTYNWNKNRQEWDHMPGGNKIVMNFPSDSNSHVNDARLVIYNYEDVAIAREELEGHVHYDYLPTAITSDLHIKGIKYADLSFTASWNEDGIPVSFNLNLYLKPFSYAINYSQSGNKVSANASITKDGEALPIIATGGTAEFMNAELEEVRRVDGFAQYRVIKMNAKVDAHGLDQATNGESATAQQLNMYTDITIYNALTNMKMGDVVFEEGEGEVVAMIHFTDGSKEKASVFLEPIFEEIENLIEGELNM